MARMESPERVRLWFQTAIRDLWPVACWVDFVVQNPHAFESIASSANPGKPEQPSLRLKKLRRRTQRISSWGLACLRLVLCKGLLPTRKTMGKKTREKLEGQGYGLLPARISFKAHSRQSVRLPGTFFICRAFTTQARIPCASRIS